MPTRRARALPVPLLCAVLLAACAEEAPEPEPVLRPVRTIIAESTRNVAPETYAGVARAGIESALSFRVSGGVEQVGVKLGDRVSRGQLLAQLDPTDYRLQVEEARASLAQSRAAVRQATADYDRVRALYENNNASKAELDAGRASAESASAQLDAGELRLQQAEQQLGYTELRAPRGGLVAQVEVETNENVQAGQMIVMLISGARPEVEVAVPESLVGRLETGQSASIAFDALPERRFTGRVSEVGVFSRGAATFDVVLEVLEADSIGEVIRSGMAAEVSFFFGEGEEAIKLPPLAIGEDGDGRFVFVLERRGETGVVRRVPVTVGDINAGGVLIDGGLDAGSEVVTAGVRRLVDGMEVRAPETPDTPPPRPAAADSTAAESTADDSTAADSTADDSTADDPTADDGAGGQ